VEIGEPRVRDLCDRVASARRRRQVVVDACVALEDRRPEDADTERRHGIAGVGPVLRVPPATREKNHHDEHGEPRRSPAADRGDDADGKRDRETDPGRLRAERKTGRRTGEPGMHEPAFDAEPHGEVQRGEEQRGDREVVVVRVRLRQDDRDQQKERSTGRGARARDSCRTREPRNRKRADERADDLYRVNKRVAV
jgi:hypothetical protein